MASRFLGSWERAVGELAIVSLGLLLDGVILSAEELEATIAAEIDALRH